MLGKTFRLRTVVNASFLLIIVLVVATSIASLRGERKLQEQSRSVERGVRIQLSLTELEKMLTTAEASQRGYLYTGDEAYLEHYEKSLEALLEQLPVLQSDVMDEKVNEQLRKIEPLMERRITLLQQTVEMQRSGKPEEARRLVLAGEGKATMDKTRELLRETLDLEDAIIASHRDAVQQATDQLWWFTIISVIVKVSCALFCTWLLSKEMVPSVAQVAHRVGSALAQLSSTVEENEVVASDQAAAVAESSATAEELNISFRHVNDQAENGLFRANQSLEIADDGSAKVEATLLGVQELEEKVKAIGEQVARLSEHAASIGTITSFVTEVANQTNMLALNAAV